MVNIATLVLPAPVGAQINKLSSDSNAFGYIFDCIRLNVDVSLLGKTSCAHDGNLLTGRSSYSLVGDVLAGTVIIS